MDDIFSWCKDGNAIQVRVWLDDPASDVNQGDDHGFGPLHWACLAGRPKIADVLLNRGARVNATNMGGDSALHLAASFGHADIVNLLLANKADVNACNEHGNTPLHYACFWGHSSIVEALLARGAQPTLANNDGHTALDRSHKCMAEQMRQLAAAYGVDLSKKVSARQLSGGGIELRSTRDATLSKFAEISLKDLTLNSKLAVTPSGETWRGCWSQAAGTQIAAKFVNYGPGAKECNSRIVSAFSDEYQRLRIFSHPNLLPVLCGVIEPPSLALVTQFCALGSLHSCLHEQKKTLAIDYMQTVRFALDIARGMAYLHSLERLVPRLYLNSFHVLVDDDLTGRINMADAKLSFQERNRVYAPAWLSPEALQKKESEINARAANVWSFAVLLWELSTRQVPFAGLSAIEVGMKVALEDLRVPINPTIPHHMARLTRICMNEEPGKRPNFDQIIPILTKMAHC